MRGMRGWRTLRFRSQSHRKPFSSIGSQCALATAVVTSFACIPFSGWDLAICARWPTRSGLSSARSQTRTAEPSVG